MFTASLTSHELILGLSILVIFLLVWGVKLILLKTCDKCKKCFFCTKITKETAQELQEWNNLILKNIKDLTVTLKRVLEQKLEPNTIILFNNFVLHGEKLENATALKSDLWTVHSALCDIDHPKASESIEILNVLFYNINIYNSTIQSLNYNCNWFIRQLKPRQATIQL